ncbi:four helix bundle protein [Fulvivirgaceae bacterium BMA10]|uniref:Four helix bundle protein n=1 Tax=Splendidivirga corallicola TaxID=3051826 RepID=A0ABT8KHG9_9BACT|nr:four helix bundle protein [Fulvivirgaceae bacterium BMA10]
MFDFEKLLVYQKAKVFNHKVREFIRNNKIDTSSKNQLQRAALSIVLNIAEGSGRSSSADKRNFYIIARGSVFECVAIFDFLREEQLMNVSTFDVFYKNCEELSKMLFGMIGRLES